MELRQLESFTVIAEELHFGRAASRLYIAQSSVSHQLQKLEAELGVALFHRSSRKVSLTPAGSAFLSDVRSVLGLLDDAVAAARSIARGRDGSVRIGTNFPAVALLRAGHPLLKRGVLPLREVSPYPYSVGRKGGSSAIKERIHHAAAAAGAALGHEVSGDSAGFFLGIASSDTVAFSSRERGEQGIASGLVLLEIEPKPEPLEIHIAWTPNNHEPAVNIVLDARSGLCKSP